MRRRQGVLVCTFVCGCVPCVPACWLPGGLQSYSKGGWVDESKARRRLTGWTGLTGFLSWLLAGLDGRAALRCPGWAGWVAVRRYAKNILPSQISNHNLDRHRRTVSSLKLPLAIQVSCCGVGGVMHCRQECIQVRRRNAQGKWGVTEKKENTRLPGWLG